MGIVEVCLGLGLVVVIAVLVTIFRRSDGEVQRARRILPAVRAIPAPMPWERSFWCRAPKGGRRG
jgi:hypothetical protein